MLVSGGVDSTVCAALLHKALQPEQVIALHIDNGFMRQNESHNVEESLRALGLHLNGSRQFIDQSLIAIVISQSAMRDDEWSNVHHVSKKLMMTS